MYCLDTSVVVDILRGEAALKGKIRALSDDGDSIVLTPITLCELYKGAYVVFNSTEKVKEVDTLVSSFDILKFNQEACKMYGEVYVQLKDIGMMTEEMDLLIASIAKAHGATLVTRNKKHFAHIRSLKVEEW